MAFIVLFYNIHLEQIMNSSNEKLRSILVSSHIVNPTSLALKYPSLYRNTYIVDWNKKALSEYNTASKSRRGLSKARLYILGLN